MKRVLLVVGLLVMCAGMVSAQGGQDDGTIVIGLSMSAHTQFLENVTDAAVNHAKSLEGVEMIVTNANDDIDTHINDVESLITKKVDVIILNPLDEAGLGRSVDNVKAAGIPLVEVNPFTNNDSYDVYVGSDEVEAGRIQGNWIAESIGESGNVCVHGCRSPHPHKPRDSKGE